jgi:type II secretory pathway predicted ATPase ExeA
MPRWFNIAGPCFAQEHYMLPPERRLGDAMELIEQGRWFALVSGRQTGKTTVAQSLATTLTARGDRLALWIDLETVREIDDMREAFTTLLRILDRVLLRHAPALRRPGDTEIARLLEAPAEALVGYLHAVCAASDRPLVLLFDEADVLVGAPMVSFLTQLRALYLDRHAMPAPQSVVLASVRSVRDYVMARDERNKVSWLGTASPFNVTVENVGLAAFTADEVTELTAQHTAETGQRFEAAANARIWELSQGHPWLVNALADQCTRRDVRDRSVAVTEAHVEAAKETIILERRTHIDSFLARLEEERVRRVLEPILLGDHLPASGVRDDVAYVAGLGLIRKSGGAWQIANPIYREVIPRALNASIQESLHQNTAWYLRDDGLLDVPRLMAAWQTFWREDGHLAAEGFTYRESGPHLMLMAFLQRIVNGGGRIDREYALGKGALDLLVTWKTQRIAIELKMQQRANSEAKGLTQLAAYLESLALDEGWLVLFDKSTNADWDTRIFTRTTTVGTRTLHVVGC